MRRFIYISLFLLLLIPSTARADIVIILRQQAEAAGNYIRVCDIARIEGPRELAVEVAKTVLGPTPARGEVREITRWEIEHRIYEMGLETIIAFTGNDTVKVTGNGPPSHRPDYSEMDGIELDRQDMAIAPREKEVRAVEPPAGKSAPSAFVDPSAEKGKAENRAGKNEANRHNPLAELSGESRETLTRTLSEFLANQYGRPDVDVEIRLTSLSDGIPAAIAGATVIEALEGRIPGKASLAVRYVDSAGKESKALTVGIEADVYALAPVAAKPLYKGDVLTAGDILVARVKMKSGSTYLPPDAKIAEGREVQKALQTGTPILATDAIPTAAVKRGATVSVDSSGKGWRLQATAKALGSGEIGDIIAVEDISTKAKYQARVTGHGIVAALPRKMNG